MAATVALVTVTLTACASDKTPKPQTNGIQQDAPRPLTLKVLNRSGRPDGDVYLALIANNNAILSPSTKLTDLTKVGDTYSYSLTADANNARLWVSYGAPLSGLPSVQPDPNSTAGPRFDIVELSYPGGSSVANLSAVDGVGIPMDITTFDAGGTKKEGLAFTCYTKELIAQLQKQFTTLGRDFAGVVKYEGGAQDANHFLRIVSPSKLVPPAGTQGYPSLEPYVKSMGALGEITVRGYYYGATAQQGEYVYKGTFDGAGNITLNGTLPPNNGPAYPLTVTGDSLYGGTVPGVYGQDSPYTVNGQKHTANDVYAAIYRDLASGFSWGYWGSKYGHGTDAADFVTGTLNPPTDATRGKPPFAAARDVAPPFVAYNIYAATIYKYSQAYSFPYADTFFNKKPTVSLTGDVATLQVTLDPDTTPNDPAHSACFE